MRTRAVPATITVLAIILVACPDAFAARTDIIVLQNGDRLTGEVREMHQGKLQVKTDDAGTLSIEWDKVASVTTAASYDVTLRDGTMLYGQLRSAAARSMQVVGGSGTVVPVAMGDVVSLAQIKQTFLGRIDGSLDLGASYTKSSGVAQLSFDTEAVYRRPSYALSASVATNLTRQPDAPDTSRYSANLGYTRYRRSLWLVSGLGLFESNRDLGFSFRGTGALALGRYVVRSNKAELLVAGGLAGGREIPLDGDTVTNVDALVSASLAIFAYDYPNMTIGSSVLVFPSLDDPGRVRINADGKLKRELFRDFYFSVSAYDAFDNRPKAASAQQNDFGASLSFGWSF